jgi:Rad3-related DNA helicase
MIEELCPTRPSELGITIDGDTWWPGQRETIDAIVSAFWTNKYVLANIPTGGGKTIVGTAVQRLLGGSALYLCHTIQLQRQCQTTMPWAVLAMGKANYSCGRDKDDPLMALFGNMTAQDCDDYGGCLKGETACEYNTALDQAAHSPQAIMNYAYGLRLLQAGYIGGQENPFRRKLLVADEGHLVEDALVEATSISIWRGTCNEAGLPPWPDSDNPYLWIAWATDASEKAKLWASDATEEVQAALNSGNDRNTTRAYQQERKARRLYQTILELRRLDPTDWAVSVNDKEVKLRPLWAWAVANDRLWRHFERVLIMSATLGDPKTLTAKLAIPSEQAEYIDVPSTFPIANRPVFYCPTVKINLNTEPEEWEAVAGMIKHIADMDRLKSEKANIHTASYKVVQKLMPYLKTDGRFMFHTTTDQKEDLIRLLKEEDGRGLFVLSPSLGTGVDIPQVRWQVIVKVPFGDLGDPITRMRREYRRDNDPQFGRRNYDEEAMNGIVQAAGRAVRGPTDWGVTYILDANVWGLYKRTYSPAFFKEAVKWLNN